MNSVTTRRNDKAPVPGVVQRFPADNKGDQRGRTVTYTDRQETLQEEPSPLTGRG